MIARLRDWGIDGRMALFIPLSTVCAVLTTALLLAIAGALANPAAFLPALYLFTLGGLVTAVFALPVTLPVSLLAWALAFAAFRRAGHGEARTAVIASGIAGLAGACAFAVFSGTDVAAGVFALILPGVVIGVMFAARLLYRGVMA